MRVKDLWSVFPLPAKIKLFWDRITFTRVTTIYFVFSILHCVVQVIFQAQAFYINAEAADFLASITEQGNALSSNTFYVFGDDLRLCHGLPTSFNASSCQMIWDGMVGNNQMVPTSIVQAMGMNGTIDPLPAIVKRSASIQDVAAVDIDDSEAHVIVEGLRGKESAVLGSECLRALGWPVQVLRETEREDIAFIMFQIWLLGMSVVAILNESVPHIIASLVTHLVVTGWAGFQISKTTQFHSHFSEVTTYGACHPVDLLPTWKSRSDAGMMSLGLNAVALLISAFLSWRLSKAFSLQTFKRFGATGTISRVYNMVLMFSIIIQLSLFFIVTSIALWLDQLWNGAIAHMSTLARVYRPVSILVLILLPPWLAFGWYSVRRERKNEMLMFLIMCLCYLAGWGTMFYSASFRWTYITWAFFGVMTTSSVSLTFLAFIFGVVCRLNFGKGLPQYLSAQEPLDDNFEAVVVSDPEKTALVPSSRGPIAFGTRTSRALLLPQGLAQIAVPRPAKTDIRRSKHLQQGPHASLPF